MYERKNTVRGRQVYLNYVMFTFPFYYNDYRNKKAGKTHTICVISGLTQVYLCVLRYRQQRSSLLLKSLLGLFGQGPMFSATPDVSTVPSIVIISENRVR